MWKILTVWNNYTNIQRFTETEERSTYIDVCILPLRQNSPNRWRSKLIETVY